MPRATAPVSVTDLPATTEPLGLIHLGGTLGSAGQPLQVLPSGQFIPRLLAVLPRFTQSPWQVIDLPVMDSSQLQPQDWHPLAQAIASHYAQGIQRFLIIHGTDTLAYTAAFLAECLAGTDLHVVITGSQLPLLAGLDLLPDPDSDAADNLRTAISTLLARPPGVWVSFNEESWPAQTVQKIHSRDRSAFAGHRRAGYPAVSYKPLSQRQRDMVAHDLPDKLAQWLPALTTLRIGTLYLSPQPLVTLETMLEQALNLYPDGLVILAYGLGNLPESSRLKHLLRTAKSNGTLVALATQTPYGGTEMRYAAGSWLDGLVLPTARMTLPAIIARLHWLGCRYAQAGERRRRWTTILNDERILPREEFRV